jgi:hypothetical protein
MENTKQFLVELWAFGSNGQTRREVDVPVAMADAATIPNLLDLIFRLGQNDFQVKPIRSVSSGDVIFLGDGSRWLVLAVGFKQLDPAAYEAYAKLSDAERMKTIW